MSRLVDDFIDTKIFKWIRVVLARQPDAEFAFVLTKADVLQRDSARVEKVRRDLLERLRRYGEESIVAIRRLHAAESAGGSGFGERLHDVTGLRFTPVRDGLKVHEHGALQESLRRLSQPKCVVVSCKDRGGVESACLQLDHVIVESNRAFPMPDLYSQVLDYVREKRADLFDKNVRDLGFALVDRVTSSSFDRSECEAILRVLHHLGDVLWYEDLVIEGLSDTVILNPMLLIDLIRQIVNHNNLSERIAHLELVRLPFWRDLDDQLMLMVKRLLYEFRIVCPLGGEMELDSDLIVPAFWQTKTEAAWLFCGQQLSLEESISIQKHEGQFICKVTSTPIRHKEVIRVRWEYHFNMLPESVFDQVVIASHSVFRERRVGPDWILHVKKNRFACRLVVTRDLGTSNRVVCLEAVTVDAYDMDLWSCFECLWESLETVLGRFRGLVFTRQAYDEKEKSWRLKDVIAEWQKQRRRTSCFWLPPDMELYGKVLACRSTRPMLDDRVGGKRNRPWP